MSRKQIMPEPFNREAVLVGDLDRKLASYLTRDTQFQRFIRNEVEIIGAYINEFLLP